MFRTMVASGWEEGARYSAQGVWPVQVSFWERSTLQGAGPGTPGRQLRGWGTQTGWRTEGPGVLWGEGRVEYLGRGGGRNSGHVSLCVNDVSVM